jgi:hypothetical protein
MNRIGRIYADLIRDDPSNPYHPWSIPSAAFDFFSAHCSSPANSREHQRSQSKKERREFLRAAPVEL